MILPKYVTVTGMGWMWTYEQWRPHLGWGRFCFSSWSFCWSFSFCSWWSCFASCCFSRWCCFSSLISSDEGQRCNLSPIISCWQSWFHWDDQLGCNELNIWNGQIPVMVRDSSSNISALYSFFPSGMLFPKHLTVQVHLELWKHIWLWGDFCLHEFLIAWKKIQLSWVHFD